MTAYLDATRKRKSSASIIPSAVSLLQLAINCMEWERGVLKQPQHHETMRLPTALQQINELRCDAVYYLVCAIMA